MKIQILSILALLVVSCGNKSNNTDKKVVARTVIQAYQDLDSATLVKYTPIQFQEGIAQELFYRRTEENFNNTFEIMRDTTLSSNNMYYVEALLSNGKKEIHAFVMAKKSKEWYVNPSALDNPFKRADILKSYKKVKLKNQ